VRCVLPCVVVACASAAPVRDTEAVLRAQIQELHDAVTAGDPRVWNRYLDPRVTYVSEAGEIETKQSLLKQIEPLPKGISGKLEITQLRVQRFGDTAVVVHVVNESENYFGQSIAAKYTMIDAWRLTGDGWRLIARQVHANLQDPPAITLPTLDDYVGMYRLTADITYAIQREGDHLVGQRSGRPAQSLSAEARDVFFVAGQPRSRKIFTRDASGKITRLIDRREGRDVVWQRE